MTTTRDDQASPLGRVRVPGRRGQGHDDAQTLSGPHFAAPGGAGGKPPRGPLPPWRAWMRKGLVLAGLAGGGFLVPIPYATQRVDTDADAEQASFEVADGFEVNLFAADPLLSKPTQINFDARGRLWVACSAAYPQIKPDQPADDKIIILEDKDGDGRAEKASVFADNLLIPTGVEPGDGGAYVGAGTELLHFQDTDGDGKADQRRVVLSGFGTEDTHHIIHTLRWGPDGSLYFNQSIYIHSHVETPWGVRRLAGGGIWRFRPDSQWLDVFARGWINTWGHAFDAWGQSFVTDGAGGQGINHAIPGGAYPSAVGVAKTLSGLNPGSPKFCGAEILSGRHFPPEWQGRIITSDFRANNVRRFALSNDASTFRATPEPDLIRTRYQAFRPIDCKMGPDGALYVADWYNPIINHGEVDFRDPRRDHSRGRIWRVTAKGRPLVPRPNLVDATTDALLDHLRAPEDWTRHFAARVLAERGREEVAGPLRAWVARLGANDPAADHARLEALWVAESLGMVAPDLLDPVLNAQTAEARAAACRVVEHWLGQVDDPFGRLAARVSDPDPRVRLEAVRALGHAPESRAAELALRVLDHPIDPTLDYALDTTIRDLRPYWSPALAAGRFDYGGDARKLLYVLGAAGSGDTVRPLVDALRAGRIPAPLEDQARNLIATLGGPAELALIFDQALDPATTAARRFGIFAALRDAAERRNVRPEGDLGRLASYVVGIPGRDPATLGNDPTAEAAWAAAVRLAGAWRLEALREPIAALAATSASNPPVGVQLAALPALTALGGERSVAALDRLTGPPQSLANRWLAARELARLDLKLAATRAVGALGPGADPGTNPAAYDPVDLFRDFLGRQGGADALTAALDPVDGTASPTILAVWAESGVRAASAAGLKPDSPLVAGLNRAGGLVAVAGRKAWPTAERAAIVRDVALRGDPTRGEALFRRGNLQCQNCHAIAGAGGRVGPGLESLGASAPVDYLVDSLVEPDKAVKEGYHATVVATTDGRVVSGIPISRTPEALTLRTSDDREESVPLSSIDEQKPAGSLMPAGLVDGLTRAELADLVRFLSELGKLGPYAVRPEVRLARRWEVAADLPAAATASPAAVALDPARRWVAAYTTVGGDLPTLDMAPAPTADGPHRLARTEVEVGTGGFVRLVVAPPTASIWVDDQPIPPVRATGEGDVALNPGRHRITLAAPVLGGAAPFRLEIRDAPGSPAQARPVLGK